MTAAERLAEIEARVKRVEETDVTFMYPKFWDDVPWLLEQVKQLRARVDVLMEIFKLCIVPLEALRITDERKTYEIHSPSLRAAIIEATDATRAYAASLPTAEAAPGGETP